jgi:glycosyltransferase involved in cell wall biosynthesis
MGGDFLLTFDRESPQSVAEALISTIQRRQQQAGVGQAARHHVQQHYSLSSTTTKWSRLYHDLLSRDRKR